MFFFSGWGLDLALQTLSFSTYEKEPFELCFFQGVGGQAPGLVK